MLRGLGGSGRRWWAVAGVGGPATAGHSLGFAIFWFDLVAMPRLFFLTWTCPSVISGKLSLRANTASVTLSYSWQTHVYVRMIHLQIVICMSLQTNAIRLNNGNHWRAIQAIQIDTLFVHILYCSLAGRCLCQSCNT